MYNSDNPSAMGWDDVIDDDGAQFGTLPEGDYNFTVTGFERAQTSGEGKLGKCAMAKLTLTVDGGDVLSTVYENIVLHTTLKWKIAAFFRSIGMKKHGEPLNPAWNKVMGRSGRAHFSVENYKNSKGEDATRNVLDNYIDYDPANFEAAFEEPKAKSKKKDDVEADGSDLPF